MSLLLLFRSGTTVPAVTDLDRIVTVPRVALRTLFLVPGPSRRRTVSPLDRTVIVPARPTRSFEVQD